MDTNSLPDTTCFLLRVHPLLRVHYPSHRNKRFQVFLKGPWRAKRDSVHWSLPVSNFRIRCHASTIVEGKHVVARSHLSLSMLLPLCPIIPGNDVLYRWNSPKKFSLNSSAWSSSLKNKSLDLALSLCNTRLDPTFTSHVESRPPWAARSPNSPTQNTLHARTRTHTHSPTAFLELTWDQRCWDARASGLLAPLWGHETNQWRRRSLVLLVFFVLGFARENSRRSSC